MFEKVLVGVDGRSGGRDAIALATRLADPASRLTLAHVRSGLLSPTHAAIPGRVAEEHEASAEILEGARSEAEIEAELISIVAGSPGPALHRRAEEQSADLLVVGSTRHGLLGRVMLGDDTRGALNGAPCAVAIAARGYADHPFPLGRIGVAYNSSPESKDALAVARTLAEPTRAELRAMEVVSIPTYAFTGLVPPAFGETVELMISEGNDRMRELEGVKGTAVYGLPGEELAAFGDELDLLVVGSRSYGPLRRLVLGSTSDYLERHARCSLLVLPRGPVKEDGEAAVDAIEVEEIP